MNYTYDFVTNRILEELEKGTIPWRKPWKNPRGAYNLISGKPYSLLNQMMLPMEGAYLTFNQIRSLGGKVVKGEKSSSVVFWKIPEVEKKEEDSEDEEQVIKKKPPILKRYSVFHVSQTEGIQIDEPEPLEKKCKKADEVFRDYIKREGISFNPKAAQAFYSPGSDSIHLPPFESFSSEDAYWSTGYHELAHSTGHARRLNRAGLKRVYFGSKDYSSEELIAEMTSAFIGNKLGFITDAELKNSASYIASWLEVLKNDKRMIVYAAAKAEKAANYILTEKLTSL